MPTEHDLGPVAGNGVKQTTTTKEGLIVPATATTNATEAAVNAARSAQATANTYTDLYLNAMSRSLEAWQRAYIAWLETGFRSWQYGLNVWTRTLDELTRVETTNGLPVLRPESMANVARFAMDETVQAQRDARRFVDEVNNSLKVGQDVAVDLAQANFRLVQSGLNYRNGQ